MRYTKMEVRPDVRKIQEDTIAFWKKNKIFERSVAEKTGGEKVFYDGPPFPTGKPHHGTVLVSFIKDMIARYWTMRGYSVPRVWGWDCHGLPIETQAEKNLELSDKKEIEQSLGVAKFNDSCCCIVSNSNDAWREYVDEMARWVDYDGAYKTMSPTFMESVIWAFKQCYDKGLIYRDYRVTPYCFRCETSLSVSDTRESDSTRSKQDPWALVRFKTDEKINCKTVYLLAWTTTPWTLPSNLALAVGAEYDYAYAETEDGVYIALVEALPRYEKIFGKNPVVIKTVKGSELGGKRYTPLFGYFAEKSAEGCFRVIPVEFVEKDEGIGIVHIAPAFGEDDYWACKRAGIPVVNPVDEKGRFIAPVSDYAGHNVLDANQDILRRLKAEGRVLASGTLEHNYPHCWRCRTPLIYKAMQAWYFSIEKIKDKLIETNQSVNWIPETVKNGRFGNWLANARDWNISRNRYWSTPIPVWECAACGQRKVLGSVQEIFEAGGVMLTDLHKQYMDAVELKCGCGGTMKRIPEVLDCWFESGCVSFAQKHYPFENKEWFDTRFPADFIVEYTGQIRCWFYYLHVMAGALFEKPAFKNCVVHGTLLAKDGKKLSKSSKNYTDPMELMKKYGTDAYRLYLYQSAAMLIGDLSFDENGIAEALQKIILPLWNSCYFFTSYAVIDGFCGQMTNDKGKMTNKDGKEPPLKNQLDRWVLAKLYSVEKNITKSMDEYGVDKYVDPLLSLIDGITNWYIRRSRRRFWGSGMPADKKAAYETLLYVLVNTCKLFAPAAPIISEELYKRLTGVESVHLAAWPVIPEKYRDDKLLAEVDAVQRVIHLARGIRTKNNVKNRQPLNLMSVAFTDNADAEAAKRAETIIAEELNVKSMQFLHDAAEVAAVRYLPNFAVVPKKYGADAGAIIQAVKSGALAFDNGSPHVTVRDKRIDLAAEDILTSYEAKPGMHVASDKGVVVALDLNITEELKREGIAREIIRNVQDMRKQINCDISDRILINFSGEQPPVEWVSHICAETLSAPTDFSDADAGCEVEGLGAGIVIKVKINK